MYMIAEVSEVFAHNHFNLKYSGQCKSTISIQQGEFILKGNVTNTMDI